MFASYSCTYACHLHVHTKNHPLPLSVCLICPFCLHILLPFECVCNCACACLCAVRVSVPMCRVCLAWTANSLCQKMSCSKNLDLRKCPLLCRYVTRCQNGHAAIFDQRGPTLPSHSHTTARNWLRVQRETPYCQKQV